MRRVDKLSVRRPAVALQDAGVVGPEHPRRLGKAAPVFNRVGGGVRGGKGPEPVRMAPDFPAGFIGRDHGAAPDLCAERRVGRLRLVRRAMDRVHQAAARDGEAEAIAEQGCDPAEGEAALFVEDHGEGDGLRAQLHGGRAERIGGLQRMTALHAPPTVPALADRDPKLVDDGALHGQVFLVLRHDAALRHRAAAVRTVRGHRRVVRDIDARGRRTMRVPPIRETRFAAGPLGLLLRQPARKRRGLTSGSAARHLELFFQPLVLAPQPVTLDLRALQILAQPIDLPRLIVDDLVRLSGRRILRASRHAPLMPKPREKYKSNHVEYLI